MDFTVTGTNRSDTLISDQDSDLLRSQIFEAVYLKTDLIRANHELSHERDVLRRSNRELEAGFSEATMIREEMKRDLEVSKERISELELETKEKSEIISKIAESIQYVDNRLSKSIIYLNEENIQEEGRETTLETEECNSKSILDLTKKVEMKVERLMKSMEKKEMEISRSVELLEEENRDLNVLLKAAFSEKQTAEKQLKEASEQKRSVLLQIAERGLHKIGFGFGFKEAVEGTSEEEENTLVIAIEKTMKNQRKEISQLKLSLEESRLIEKRLKKLTEEQAQKLEENEAYIHKLQNREIFLTQNVEELVKVIREADSEISRWREACELEVEAGQREVEERDQIIAVLKAEMEKMRSALEISEGKLKLKEELAKAAMRAEEAAEKSLRLAERRIAQLLNRIEHFYRQLEESESTERRKFRYVWCWPLWRLPAGSSSGVNNRALLRYGA